MMDAEALLKLVHPLLGKPYQIGANGPHAYDCWGLVQYVGNQGFDYSLPRFTADSTDVRALVRFFQEHPERRNWHVVEKPVHGAVVLLSHASYPHHAGLYLDFDGGGILHAEMATGVYFDTLFRMKLSGWRGFIFHVRG